MLKNNPGSLERYIFDATKNSTTVYMVEPVLQSTTALIICAIYDCTWLFVTAFLSTEWG